MMPKTKTHFEEVPLEAAQKIAEEQIASQAPQETRGEQFRGPTRKRSSKALKAKAKVAGQREDA